MLQLLEFRMVTHATRKRVYFTAFTFTTPLFWYSFHFAPFELNRSLYDVTHWSYEGLPCVAILFTTLSFPRSICKYRPIAFWRVHQAPTLALVLLLLRRACHGSYFELQDEDAFTASFGISLFSILRGWMRHSVGRKTDCPASVRINSKIHCVFTTIRSVVSVLKVWIWRTCMPLHGIRCRTWGHDCCPQ